MTRPAKYLLSVLVALVAAVAWSGHHIALSLRYRVVQADSGMVLDTWTRELCTVRECVSLPQTSHKLASRSVAMRVHPNNPWRDWVSPLLTSESALPCCRSRR